MNTSHKKIFLSLIIGLSTEKVAAEVNWEMLYSLATLNQIACNSLYVGLKTEKPMDCTTRRINVASSALNLLLLGQNIRNGEINKHITLLMPSASEPHAKRDRVLAAGKLACMTGSGAMSIVNLYNFGYGEAACVTVPGQGGSIHKS
jgi:hypothetical protein